MKYLITGGAGFIGSHLAEALLAEGHEVYVIDNLSTGNIENIEPLKKNARFHYVIDTIFNEPLMEELVDACNIVFHLAAAVGVMLIVKDPIHTIETNIRGTAIVLQAAAKKKKRVVIASTSEVYGKSNNVPFGEESDLVLGPTTKGRWSYACSKAIDEFLALSYWKQKGVPVIITRLFNTVGPRQTGHYGMVIPRFVRQALAREPITVYGSGKQTRCFAYVGDVVRGLIQLTREPCATGQVFNIGNDEEIAIEELARLVKENTGSTSEIKYVPYDQAYEEGFEDMPRRVPDLSKIKAFIGYQPTVDIQVILERVIAYFSMGTRK